ncbi:SulP family inorganic anion transporter [Segetibacter aerophilus]|uniref:Sulfate permease n=1 Tax=Segetibacter aerophilus TaxID=670293 RepID=A0A512BJ83_9BACT|nr:SulP family inorganic anion transporter [Segetibacter aerophilus]GEO12022.1 sulfate permease [Segetibacter aerophilus]
MKKSVFTNLKYDIPSSIVVFLVAVPLCLGIALASGAPFFSGLIAGIVGGIVIGSLSNSQLSVSGPAAGLTAIVLAGITRLGAFETFLAAVFLAGLIQLLLGFLKAGSIANYFPGSVIKGMLTAIGVIIILKQIPHAFGYDKDAEGETAFQQANGNNTFSALLEPLQHIHIGVTIITLVALTILVLWEKPFMKRFKVVPGALAAVVVSVLLNNLFNAFFPAIAVEKEHLVQVPVAGSFDEFLGLFTLPNFSAITNKDVIITAFTIAAVASIETLLCIEAVDKMDRLRRATNQNRELKAQGIGNMVSGLLGGLPVTSVIVRSSANINAGAQTKASTIIHGTLILVCSAFIPGVLNMIPLGALAAILLITGYKLARISIFKEMFANGKYQWVPFIVTVVAVVFTDLLTGVGLGLLTSMVAILYGNMKNSYYFHKENHHEGEVIRIQLSEEVSFLNKASIKLTLNHLPANSKVVIDATKTTYIDYDVLELIKEFKNIKAPEKNIDCILTGLREKYKIDNTHHVISERQAFTDRNESFTNQETGILVYN